MSRFFEPLENRTMFSGTIAVATLQPNAYEQGQQPASFIVYRQDRVPTATRVYFTVGGTATSNLAAFPKSTEDYTGITAPPLVLTLGTSSLTKSAAISPTSSVRAVAPAATPALASAFGGNTGYVDIPAEQTYAVVTITPVDDTRAEPMETAIFTLKSDPAYTISTPSSATVYIHDNDGPHIAPDVADAYVHNGASADTNFGHATELQVKRAVTSSGLSRGALVQFDLSGIDPLSTINNVSIKLFGSLNNANQKNVPVSLLAVPDMSWSENSITWNNEPKILISLNSPALLGPITVIDTTPRWYTLDITSYVKTALANGAHQITFLLSGQNVSDPYVTFHSREASTNQPELVFNG